MEHFVRNGLATGLVLLSGMAGACSDTGKPAGESDPDQGPISVSIVTGDDDAKDGGQRASGPADGADAAKWVPCLEDSGCTKGEVCAAVSGKTGVWCVSALSLACGDRKFPAVEICNGKDDDCDGFTDEGKDLCDDGNPCTTDACVADADGAHCAHEPLSVGLCDDGNACTGCVLPKGVLKHYNVTETADCPEKAESGCNALWMKGFFDCTGVHIVRFVLEPGATFDWFDDGTGLLQGVAKVYNLGEGPGDLGSRWNLTLHYEYRGQGAAGEGTGGPKTDGFDVPKSVTDAWQYFDLIPGQGSMVSVDDTSQVVEFTQSPVGSAFPFQLGDGATMKSMAYGASAWMTWTRTAKGTCEGNGDINVDFHEPLCDVCVAGQCQPGTAKTCDDETPCTSDTCDTKTGECIATPLPVCATPCQVGADCDDGNACTVGEVCANGVCLVGTPLDCDDSNRCTTDVCEPAIGCVHTDNSLACSDGSACTVGDTCANGACVPGPTLSCNDGNVCTDDSCNPGSGCVHVNNTLQCDDNNNCTIGDACTNGNCVPTATSTCDDANPCTTESCEPASGCLHTNNILPCSDGSVCTTGDTCAGGACVPGQAQDCNDGNPCTDDSCDAGAGCQNLANTLPCDDGNACTDSDVCTGGVCQPGAVPDCGDGNLCTTDFCEPAIGCQHSNNTLPCSDGSVCTIGDLCANGSCVPGTALACDDGNPCTDDSCIPGNGCVHVNNTLQCDDNNNCTNGDACTNGSCVPTGTSSCDDGNPCTTESCDANSGCTSVNNNLPCSDGSVCTTGDTCAGAACVPGPAQDCNDGNPCTNDSCDAVAGCQNLANTLPCDDGNACTLADTCAGGVCVAGAAPDCNDGNLCTTDACDPASGCFHTNNTLPCSDGSVCTVGDICASGACVSGTALACDDGNVCTDDSCDAGSGCVHTNNTASCSDGSLCTVGDVCAAGACVPGTALDCNDSNMCTADSCDPSMGCVSTTTTNACDQASVGLGTASNFAILAGATITNTGPTSITGDVGVSPGTAITGFPPGTIVGTVHATDAVAAQAESDLTTAYNDAAGRTQCLATLAGNLGGQTLSPGTYTSTSSLEISSGDLILDGQGDCNAVFVFQMVSTLITFPGRNVILINGANPANIFWQVGSSATLGTNTIMYGTIMADQSITLNTGATLNGRALASVGAVTLDSNTVVNPVP